MKDDNFDESLSKSPEAYKLWRDFLYLQSFSDQFLGVIPPYYLYDLYKEEKDSKKDCREEDDIALWQLIKNFFKRLFGK